NAIYHNVARWRDIGKVIKDDASAESSIQSAIGVISDDRRGGLKQVGGLSVSCYQDFSIRLKGHAIGGIVAASSASESEIRLNRSAGAKSRVQASVGIESLQGKVVVPRRTREDTSRHQDFPIGLNGERLPLWVRKCRTKGYSVRTEALVQRAS